MKKNLLQYLVILIISFSSFSFAQGILSGTVSDSSTNDALVGANVYLTGTSLGAAVDIQGHYRITLIPQGTYTVKISYVGYTTKQYTVKINNNQTTALDAKLSPQVLTGQEVVVSAQALGQAAAINQQLSSNTIVNVISEQKIQEMPDANAAEAIGRLPGVSIQRSGGEANKIVLRGLDEKYSTITVDGIRIASTDENDRGIDLSTLSQGSLAGIELYKALTPDKDADAIAGTVNLVTKKAPEERIIRFDAKGVYDKLDKDAGQYNFAGRYGERFFNNLLGVQAEAHAEQIVRSRERTNIDYDQGLTATGSTVPNSDYEITDFHLLYTNEIRQKQGGELILDYNSPDGGSIKLSNNYNTTFRNIMDNSRNFPTNGDFVIYEGHPQKQQINIFQSSLTGDNYLFGFHTTWGLSFAQSKAFYPYNYVLQFEEPNSTDAQGNILSGMRNINTRAERKVVSNLIPAAVNNFSSAYAYGATFRHEQNLDRDRSAYIDLSKNYIFGTNLTGAFKFGAKYRQKNRYRDLSRVAADYYLVAFNQNQRAADGSIVPKNFSGTIFSGYDLSQDRIYSTNFIDTPGDERNIFDTYRLYPELNRDRVEKWWSLNQFGVANDGTSEYQNDAEAKALYYDIIERISSAYAMNTFNLGNYLTFIAGLRVETEANNYNSKNAPYGLTGFPVPAGLVFDTSSAHNEAVWLPNFQFLIKPNDFLNIRLAAYRALARPDFNYRLAQFVPRGNTFNLQAGTENLGSSALTVGNPGLKAAKAWNFEINTSFYGNKIGLFSVSVFYKDIKDMYRYINGAQVAGQEILDSLGIKGTNPYSESVTYDLYYPYNSPRPTKVWGFEVEHQTYLGFLPGLLKNITLSYNFSIIRSEAYTPYSTPVVTYVTVPGLPFPKKVTTYVLIEKKQKLEGQPEFYGNFAIGYDIDGFSGRVSVFHQGEYNQSFSADGRGDNITNAYTKVDLALKQQITDWISVILNVNNITNTKERTTIINRVQNWRLDNTAEIYGTTADFGIRVTL